MRFICMVNMDPAITSKLTEDEWKKFQRDNQIFDEELMAAGKGALCLQDIQLFTQLINFAVSGFYQKAFKFYFLTEFLGVFRQNIFTLQAFH